MMDADVGVILFLIFLVALGSLFLTIGQGLLAKRIQEQAGELDRLRRKLDEGLPHEYWSPEEADS